MRDFRIQSPVSFLIALIVFLHLIGNSSSGDTRGTDTSTTRPAAPATFGADAISAARQAMLDAADRHIASLRALLDQIPSDQRSASETNQRLQELLTQRAQIESATDGEIAARIAARRADVSNTPKPPAVNAPSLPKLDQNSATTKPAVSALETQIVFPGSSSHGQSDAIVRAAPGCDLVTLHARDGTKIAAVFGRASTSGAGAARPSLLYFYGNGTCMAYSRDVFNRYRSLGFNVIMADYEGYGMSNGTPSEAGCYAAADAAYEYLLTRNDVDHRRIVAAGWSLGAAVAIDLASRRQLAGLVTFSAFTNLTEMSQSLLKGLPLAILLNSRFDNLAKISSVSCPIFMAHGSRDTLVAPEMLDRLAKAAQSKVTTLRVDAAGHNDIFQRGGDSLFLTVKAFVDGLSAVSPSTRPDGTN